MITNIAQLISILESENKRLEESIPKIGVGENVKASERMQKQSFCKGQLSAYKNLLPLLKVIDEK